MPSCKTSVHYLRHLRTDEACPSQPLHDAVGAGLAPGERVCAVRKGLGDNPWRAVRHSKSSGELVGGIEAEVHVDLADGALESLQKADATTTAQIKEMQTSIASLKKNAVHSAEREAAWLLPNTATQMLRRPVEKGRVIGERYQELLQTNEGALRALAQAAGYESAEQFVSALPGLVLDRNERVHPPMHRLEQDVSAAASLLEDYPSCGPSLSARRE
jgi:hypothetical protein